MMHDERHRPDLPDDGHDGDGDERLADATIGIWGDLAELGEPEPREQVEDPVERFKHRLRRAVQERSSQQRQEQ